MRSANPLAYLLAREQDVCLVRIPLLSQSKVSPKVKKLYHVPITQKTQDTTGTARAFFQQCFYALLAN